MKRSKIIGMDHGSLMLEPIQNLKIGDLLVRVKAGSTRIPAVGDCVRVNSLHPADWNKNGDITIRRNDFTFLWGDIDGIIETSGDSRYFERVEE